VFLDRSSNGNLRRHRNRIGVYCRSDFPESARAIPPHAAALASKGPISARMRCTVAVPTTAVAAVLLMPLPALRRRQIAFSFSAST
jgi:hypothetical protein